MNLQRYRTEIVIPADRLVTLALPPHLPEGPAIVTILIASPTDEADHDDPNDHGRAWWEEFDDEP